MGSGHTQRGNVQYLGELHINPARRCAALLSPFILSASYPHRKRRAGSLVSPLNLTDTRSKRRLQYNNKRQRALDSLFIMLSSSASITPTLSRAHTPLQSGQTDKLPCCVVAATHARQNHRPSLSLHKQCVCAYDMFPTVMSAQTERKSGVVIQTAAAANDVVCAADAYAMAEEKKKRNVARKLRRTERGTQRLTCCRG